MIYAGKEDRSSNFIVKTYNPRHKCHKTNINFLCNSKYLANHYKERIISQPTIKGWKIQDLVREDFGVYVGKAICLKTRKIILKEVMGDHIAEFGRLFDYRDVLLQINHGSTCIVKVADLEDGKKEFISFYICFASMKRGFLEGCRKCIGLDGCFLKGICKGQLLVAVAKDGNNQMFPIAWAVIGTEKKETWTWFMRILQEDLQLGDGNEITIISDMQKGFVSVAEEVFPACEHRMCARHILSNWSKKWRGIERRKKFWSCARATYEAELKKRLDELNTLGHNIVEDLISYNKERWCKVYFKEFSKCDSVDNNMSESFNAWILGARHKTIVSMLEEIRVKVMIRIPKMRAFAKTWVDEISPMTLKNFNTNVEKSMKCKIHWNGEHGFEIQEGIAKFIVHLERGYCSCRSWQLKGIPCAHAITTMQFRMIDASESIASWYRKETYLRAYSNFIQSVPNMIMWPAISNPKIEPPTVRKMPGRPKKNRRKEEGEIKRTGKLSKRGIAMTCSICKSIKHNKRSCPSRPEATSATRTTEYNATLQSSTGSTRKRSVVDSQQESTSKGGEAKASRRKYKSPRVVRHGVFVSKTGYSCVNQGLQSSRLVTTLQ
uniref:Uncharacterized protein isoform X1 n=2 Tax=Nicotiana TaxID=4085 RepID=A0A1S3XDW9_TOBAC|nr:PREDICTED: uncharacterized protein LOC107764034 isoform X1 [Nicotiana tabacum]